MEWNRTDLLRFIESLPKAELHLHIEGTLEPEMLLSLAQRNGVPVAYDSIDSLRAAYSFNNLQEFLDLYYAGAGVLVTERDFYGLTMAYLEKAAEQQVVHAEIFFDPQTHTARGIPFGAVIGGISAALEEGNRKLGISSRLILCFLRHLSERSAMETLAEAKPYRHLLTGVGLDSSERGNPPGKFRQVFALAAEEGLLPVVHAGEEGPAAYVREALDLLKARRIDHGIRSIKDPLLVQELADRQIPLTVCPLSNLRLKVVSDLREHPLKKLLDRGVRITLHSDDPAYFGGYITENYRAAAEALELTPGDIRQLAVNAFEASFLDEKRKTEWIAKVDSLYRSFPSFSTLAGGK